MEQIKKQAIENRVPIVRPITLKMLIDEIKKNSPKHILEIGTAIGYSAVNMLNNCDGKLTTIEINADNQNMAIENVTRLGLSDRVEFLLGDAKEILKSLVKENRRYDFVFLDGPKGQYLNYLDDLTKLLNVGGIIFADDVLFRGMVKAEGHVPHRHRTIVVNLRKYLDMVKLKPYESTVFDIEDGVCISKKVE